MIMMSKDIMKKSQFNSDNIHGTKKIN